MRIQTIFKSPMLAAAIFGLGLAGSPLAGADELPAPKVVEKAAPIKSASNAPGKAVAPAETASVPVANVADGSTIRIVAVEWKIKKGREQEFLDYWATRSTIPNRSGLIAEFLSNVDSKEKWPWINWTGPIDKPGITTFYNVGIWRDGDSFQDQIGKYVDNNRPPLDFEAEKRTRIFLAPARWRVGETLLPKKDSDGTK